MIECAICFEILKKNDKTLQCNICKIKYHKSCYNEWNNIKNDDKCVFCMSENSLVNCKKKFKLNFDKREHCIHYCNIL